MAKIVDYAPKTVASEWAEDAATLAGLDAGKAIVIEGTKGARVAFQRAAREAGFTARCVDTVETKPEQTDKDGAVTVEAEFEFTFIRVELRTRKGKDEAEAEAEQDAEVADGE